MLTRKNMRTLNYRFLLLVSLVAISITSCKEDDDTEIGDPFSKIEGLTATDWIVAEVFLVDESNPAKPERDISNYYTSTANRLEMSYNIDGTFVVTAGDGLNFFPSSGSWMFDNDQAPTAIILTSDEGVTEMPLAGPTRISDAQLKIQFVKEYCQVEGVSKGKLGYRLVFNRKS